MLSTLSCHRSEQQLREGGQLINVGARGSKQYASMPKGATAALKAS